MPLSGNEFIDEIQEMVQRKHSEERTPNMLNALSSGWRKARTGINTRIAGR
jgi:hypothetical protein